MASKAPTSNKRILIDKSNTSMVIAIALAAFISVFSIIASKALLGQRSYQSRVIKEKKIALARLKLNNKAATKLVGSYQAFVSSPENVIGGSSGGTGDKDGDNAKIILDALPSKYDFPALATSLEKILKGQNFKINGISGTDDELKQSAAVDTNTPVDMPFEVSVTGSYDSAQVLSDTFQRSIRPIKISKIHLSGKDDKLTILISAKTNYQPEKIFKISTKVVK